MLHPSLFGYWLQSRGEAMPRPCPATPRVAHRPEAMPRPYPATPRVAHHPEAMPRPCPATPRVAHRPEAQLRAGAKKPRADEGGTPEGRGFELVGRSPRQSTALPSENGPTLMSALGAVRGSSLRQDASGNNLPKQQAGPCRWPEFTSPVSGGVAMDDRGRGMASPLRYLFRKPVRLPG